MENKFLNPIQSKALRDLGYKEQCLAYYNLDPYFKEPIFNLRKPFEHDWLLPAPLKYDAFRWFREEFGLHGIIAPRFYSDGSLWYVSEEINISKNNIETLNNNLFQGVFEMYETHKQAEHICINKLIELAKNIVNN